MKDGLLSSVFSKRSESFYQCKRFPILFKYTLALERVIQHQENRSFLTTTKQFFDLVNTSIVSI